ncbi:MAG TPA: ATP-binding protein [Telluria sp.]|nr:ATP-binding protein [Telluria sp.]
MNTWPVSLRATVDLILDSSFPMFVAWGSAHSIIYNDAYVPILGSRHPAALGLPFSVLWSEIWDDIGPLMAAAREGRTSHFENMEVHLLRNGYPETAYFTFSYSPVRGDGGEVEGVFGVCNETTATVASERDQRGQAEMMRQMFEQAPGFMAVLRGPEHVIEMENAAYRQLLGGREALGRRLVDVMPELAEQGVIELLDRVLRTADPYVGRCERFVLRQPGGAEDEAYLDFVYQPIVNALGEAVGIFVQGHEVTGQYRARQALLAADHHKDQFIATLAHELRNPLAPIRAAARLLESGNLKREQVSHTTGVITRQVEQMAHLLDDLLDVARITKNQVRLQKAAVNADELVSLALETTGPLIESRKHSLRVVHHDGAIELDADPVRIVQVVSNLLSNAAKYTDPGGMVTVETRLDGDTCVIKVRDNGIGLRREALRDVFRMFSQEQSALERSEGGLGIGLALVKGLVDLHGGTVEAESAGVGGGCEFTVRLPAARRASFALKPQDPVREIRVRRRSILLADDNRDLVDMLSQFLELQGHSVVKARDGLEALALARTVQPDVAILDIGMPGMNGYQLAQAIRREPWGENMLLVAATGWGHDDDKGRAAASGFDTHITKPFGLDSLEALLEHSRQPALAG